MVWATRLGARLSRDNQDESRVASWRNDPERLITASRNMFPTMLIDRIDEADRQPEPDSPVCKQAGDHGLLDPCAEPESGGRLRC